MRYFRNDKLDLVNREKQRFGFRKLSSGKIASVLLGVTIFGSFALNGQVVKADTPTDGSQTSAVSTQNKEEQSGQDLVVVKLKLVRPKQIVRPKMQIGGIQTVWVLLREYELVH